MNQWKRYPETKPARTQQCLVSNDKGFMGNQLAMYYADSDVFTSYNTPVSYTLGVTHYIEIPPLN